MSRDDAYERDFLRRNGRTEEKIDRELETRAHNKLLQNSFFGATLFGGFVAALNTPIHFIQSENLIEWVENSEFLRYFANHVKGAGQAIMYTQMATMLPSMLVKENVENKRSNSTGIFTSEPTKDFSVIMGMSCILGGYAWEKVSQVTNVNNVFDTHDMAWIAAGAIATIAWNKASMAFARQKHPQVYATPIEPQAPQPPAM